VSNDENRIEIERQGAIGGIKNEDRGTGEGTIEARLFPIPPLTALPSSALGLF